MDNMSILIINFFVGFYNSQAFFVLKFILGIYLAVLIADIILLMIARGVGANVRYLMHGENIPIALTTGKKKTRKKWNELLVSLESESENDWKVMIIKADDMIFQLIRRLGHKEDSMGEALEKVDSNHIHGIENVKEAHQIRNRIIHEDNFVLKKDEVKEVMNKYETFLDFFEV